MPKTRRKTEIGTPEAGSINLDFSSHNYYTRWDLKRKIVEELQDFTNKRLDAEGIKGDQREALLSELFGLLSSTGPDISLPNKAPELYEDRIDRKEKPEAFLERVYGCWLNGNGLYRSHIKAWNLGLYQALYKRRKEISDFDTLLPTAQGRSVDDLARSDSEILANYRKRDAANKKRNYGQGSRSTI